MTLLGIDAGLTNVKAALFDREGRERAVAVRETPGVSPAPDLAEQEPDALWAAVADAIGAAIDAGPGDAGDVDGVGVAGHGHGLYTLDADGAPVRNGIKSTDDRALDLVAEWEADGTLADVASTLGYEPFGADPVALLAWLRREEPANYRRIDRLCFCKDYLKYRLTGTVCTDPMEASALFDAEAGEYATGLLSDLGLGAAADALPEIVPSGGVCGTVTDAAAEATGLEPGTPVGSGLHDVGATALGAGVHEPGQGMLIVGTWGQSIAILDGPRSDAGLTRQFLPGRWLCYKGNRSAAACLDWFLETCCRDWGDPYERANRAVENAPAGAGGLLFHPSLHGSTDDPAARGGFCGLRAEHDRRHMLRAIYEGVAMAGARRLREVAPEGGLDSVHMGGGGARSAVWTGVFADVLEDQVTVPDGTELGARGAALCAGVATGAYDGFADAVEAAVGVDREHEPDPEAAALYRELRELFAASLAAVAPTWEGLRALPDGD